MFIYKSLQIATIGERRKEKICLCLSSLFRKFGDVFSNIGLKAHSSEKSPLPPFNQRGDIVPLPFVKGGGEGFQGPF